MGVAGLWDILHPAAKTRSLTELSVTEGFEANPDGVRGFRIGIDASIWFFHAEYGREGENPVLRTLFFRCATLMHSPFLPLFVFDGPKRPDFKRGKNINKTGNKLIPGMKQIIEAFGFEHRMAPGEAEAELAYLNRIGIIDGILSDDVDNFLFGAINVIRNPSNNLSGNKANPSLNSAGKDDKNHTRVYRISDISSNPSVGLNRGGLILIGLMSGGDYQQGGLLRCGTITAHGLAKCGFGDSLYDAATSLTRDQLPTFLDNWRKELRQELRTNSQGYLGRKQVALANSVPDNFPDIDILLSYVNPITSESLGREANNLKLTWSKEPDLAKLAATCELYFEWGYKEAIIKRFRTVIWHSAVLRIIRRAVLEKESVSSGIPSTPRKKIQQDNSPGTPSKLITKHFSSFSLAATSGHLSVDCEEEDPDNRLIVKIHSSRRHPSTDNILEYRLEINPSQLVRIAESGIRGLRSPEESDEWASEDTGDDVPVSKTGAKKPQPDPQNHMRVWMPASMVVLAEPRLAKEYEKIAGLKDAKKANAVKGAVARKNQRSDKSEDKAVVSIAPVIKIKQPATNLAYIEDNDVPMIAQRMDKKSLPESNLQHNALGAGNTTMIFENSSTKFVDAADNFNPSKKSDVRTFYRASKPTNLPKFAAKKKAKAFSPAFPEGDDMASTVGQRSEEIVVAPFPMASEGNKNILFSQPLKPKPFPLSLDDTRDDADKGRASTHKISMYAEGSPRSGNNSTRLRHPVKEVPLVELDVIEISSDSDSGSHTRSTETLLPLVAARAKLKSKAYVSVSRCSTGHPSHLSASNSSNIDIIDLT